MNEEQPLLSVYNNNIDNTLIRWCTPSIHPSVPRIRGVYENDISISYHSMGNPSTDTGVFHQAHMLAARAYHAENTLFTVNGSTGSNFVVLRSLKKQLGNFKLVAQRNIHKSICVAIEDNRIDATYIEPNYDQELQVFLPNTDEQILNTIKKVKPQVFFISNPTYEGISKDLKSLIKKIRKIDDSIIIYVDEAWGAHFPFSPLLPTCAMDCDADICVQSTHKLGSGLQQTSMIHWKNKRIQKKYIFDSFKALATTSPSFHLLASLDGTRYFMEHFGAEAIEKLYEHANIFKKLLKTIEGVHVVNEKEFTTKAIGCKVDGTKVLLNLKGISGVDLALRLEKIHNIVVEKYEANNVLFIVTFQITQVDIEKTVEAIAESVKHLKRSKTAQFPSFPATIQTAQQSWQVENFTSQSIPLKRSLGKICAEDVVPYPPGIPLIIKGEVIQKEHIEYLLALKKLHGLITVLMNDESIQTILVIKEHDGGSR